MTDALLQAAERAAEWLEGLAIDGYEVAVSSGAVARATALRAAIEAEKAKPRATLDVLAERQRQISG